MFIWNLQRFEIYFTTSKLTGFFCEKFNIVDTVGFEHDGHQHPQRGRRLENFKYFFLLACRKTLKRKTLIAFRIGITFLPARSETSTACILLAEKFLAKQASTLAQNLKQLCGVLNLKSLGIFPTQPYIDVNIRNMYSTRHTTWRVKWNLLMDCGSWGIPISHAKLYGEILYSSSESSQISSTAKFLMRECNCWFLNNKYAYARNKQLPSPFISIILNFLVRSSPPGSYNLANTVVFKASYEMTVRGAWSGDSRTLSVGLYKFSLRIFVISHLVSKGFFVWLYSRCRIIIQHQGFPYENRLITLELF